MGVHNQRKYIDIFLKTVEKGIEYEGEIEKLNILNTDPDKLHKINSNHVTMFKFKHQDKDSVLIFVCLPINSKKETSTSKSVAERVMNVIKDMEIAFTYLDYNSSNTDSNAFIYLKMIKTYDEACVKKLIEKQQEDK